MEENLKRKNIFIYIGAAILVVILVIVAIPKLIGMFNKGKGSPVSYNVALTKEGFNPKDITIKKGDVVVWTNNSGKQASVNSADQPTHQKFPFLNLGPFENGQILQTPFNQTGKFEYVNHLNPKDTGTVKVE